MLRKTSAMPPQIPMVAYWGGTRNRAHIVYCNNYSTILRNDSLFLLKMLEI
jgi:hypothetical protein